MDLSAALAARFTTGFAAALPPTFAAALATRLAAAGRTSAAGILADGATLGAGIVAQDLTRGRIDDNLTFDIAPDGGEPHPAEKGALSAGNAETLTGNRAGDLLFSRGCNGLLA